MAVDKQIIRETGTEAELTMVGNTHELQDGQAGRAGRPLDSLYALLALDALDSLVAGISLVALWPRNRRVSPGNTLYPL
jgi:hypothetical protein